MPFRFQLLLFVVANATLVTGADIDQRLESVAAKDQLVVRELLLLDPKTTWDSDSTKHVTMIGFDPNGVADKAIALLPGLRELKTLELHQKFNDRVDWSPGNLRPLTQCENLRELLLVIGEHHTVQTWRSLPELYQLTKVEIVDQTLASLPLLDRFPRATRITIRCSGPPMLEVQQLGKLKHLQSISLRSQAANWHGEGLSRLKICPVLEEISIGGAGVSDVGLAEIGTLPNVKRLSLGQSQISQEGLKQISGLESFRSAEPTFTDELAIGLSNCRSLKRLELSGTAVTGKCFEVLSKLPLEEINCAGLTTENFRFLKPCTTLRQLQVNVFTRDERKLQKTILSNILPKVELIQTWMGEKADDPKSGK